MPWAFYGCHCTSPNGDPKWPHNFLVIEGYTIWACRQCFGLYLPPWHHG